jgi:hypothetical protein
MKLVKINSENNILLFKRMNKEIVDSYKRRGIIPTMREHKKTFEATHGVKVEMGESGNFWSHLEFLDEQAYIMALLKWGS